MLFHTFHSQEERRKSGGSYFIEVQYCSHYGKIFTGGIYNNGNTAETEATDDEKIPLSQLWYEEEAE